MLKLSKHLEKSMISNSSAMRGGCRQDFEWVLVQRVFRALDDASVRVRTDDISLAH